MQAATLSQLLVFQLAAREYALPIESIVEVLRMVALAPVAHSPAGLSGVVNLRGRVVPVLDLRVRLGLASQPVDLTTPLVIVALRELVFGQIVDSATEVLGVSADNIEIPGALSGDNHMLSGIARHGARLIFILDAALLVPASFPRLAEPVAP
jgi:purine-binding chemotaxis protein CheW